MPDLSITNKVRKKNSKAFLNKQPEGRKKVVRKYVWAGSRKWGNGRQENREMEAHRQFNCWLIASTPRTYKKFIFNQMIGKFLSTASLETTFFTPRHFEFYWHGNATDNEFMDVREKKRVLLSKMDKLLIGFIFQTRLSRFAWFESKEFCF